MNRHDGSLCPTCGGAGRRSPRYPAALCHSCENMLIDAAGRKATLFNEDFWGGVRVEAGGDTLPREAPLFVNGIEYRAREARFGGVVVQRVEAREAVDEGA